MKESKVDYLVVSHIEPNHSANIELLSQKYPEMKIILSQKVAEMMNQFFNTDLSDKFIIVKEGEIIERENHRLQFFMAPMVHWPEVMVTYEQTEKVLFTVDGFGKFGTLDTDEDWACEARRYYYNICGKYGMQVQLLLKKVANLDVKTICSLHGPILQENLEYYINKYDIWNSYKPEDNGVFVAYNSIHGNTRKAIEKLESVPEEEWIKVENTHEAIIDKEIFEKAQNYKKIKSSPKTKKVSIWAGVLKCADCRRAMTKKSSTNSHGKKYEYYICSTYINKSNKLCSKHTINVENLEKEVLKLLNNRLKKDHAFNIKIISILLNKEDFIKKGIYRY